MGGLLLSVFAVRETRHHAAHESQAWAAAGEELPTQREVCFRTSFVDKTLSSVSQAGLVNNLNDGVAWGAFPLFFAAAGMSLRDIGTLAAIYPSVWGIGQHHDAKSRNRR